MIWLFLKFSPYVEHMGNVWGTYGDRTGSPYVPHMFPIGFDCSSVATQQPRLAARSSLSGLPPIEDDVCTRPPLLSCKCQWDVCESPGFPSNRVAAGQVYPPAVRITMVCSLFACHLSASEAFLFLSGAVYWVFSNAYSKEEHLLGFFRGW